MDSYPKVFSVNCVVILSLLIVSCATDSKHAVPDERENSSISKKKDFEKHESEKEIIDKVYPSNEVTKDIEVKEEDDPRDSALTSEEYEQRQLEAVLQRLRLLGGVESEMNEKELEEGKLRQKKGQFLQEQQSTQQQEPPVTIEK
ncbi:MAG: hypothetical protein HC877_17625 [Thioploca sp.]|nr:hypothetical protein [Thioploca sp.]